jgi:hypothetical protein
MIKSMKAGSVVMDLAAESGGNVEGSVAGETIRTENGVTIIGAKNLPSKLAPASSLLYAKNLMNFVMLLVDKETKAFKVNEEDDLVKGTLDHQGRQGRPSQPAERLSPRKRHGSDRSRGLRPHHLRARDLRRLLRRLVGDAGAAHALDGDHQRDQLGDRRRRPDRGRCRRRCRHGLGFIAVLLASVNIFGGFAVTRRMLAMFKKRT